MSACLRGPVRLPVRVLVADDADGVRELVMLLLDMESDFTVVGQARDGVEAVKAARAARDAAQRAAERTARRPAAS